MVSIAVIPVLIGPLQVLLALLPAILAALATVAASLLKPRTMLALLKLVWRLKFQLAAIILLFWGGTSAVRYFLPETGRGGGGAAAVRDRDWPMFRGDVQRSGHVPAPGNVPDPTRGGVVWSRAVKDAVFYASPAVSGNRIYITSVEGIGPFDKDGRGTVYCLDASSGNVVWSFAPTFTSGARRYRATFSSPVVKGNRLVVGEGLHATKNCRVICLDISDESNIKLAWSVETDNHVECTPIIGAVKVGGAAGRPERVEDRVFIGNGDTGGYLCIALATGKVIWHQRGKRYLDAETALAYHDNRLYAGLGNDGKALCVMDAVTGKELGRIDTRYPVFGPPAVVDSTFYIGMGNGDYVYRAAELGLPARGEVWAVDVARVNGGDGVELKPRWKLPVAETVLGAVSVHGKHLYFATVDGWVYAVDRDTGGNMARWNAHGIIKSSPAVAKSHVYVTTAEGMLYALDTRNLKPVWQCSIGGGAQNFSSPAVARGHVYVGTEKSGVICAGEPAPAGPVVWPGHLGGAGQGGNPDGQRLLPKGQFVWNYPAAWDGKPAVAALVAPISVQNELLVVPVARKHDRGPEPGLFCLKATQGSEAPESPVWALPLTNGVHRSAAIVGDRVFAVDGVPGDSGRHLRAVRIADGAPVWRHAVAAQASGIAAAADDTVWVSDAPARLTCLGLNGDVRWAANLPGDAVVPPAVAPGLVVQAVAGADRLVVLDRRSGTPLLAVALAGRPTGGACLRGRIAYVPTAAGLQAVDLVSGKTPSSWRGGKDVPSADLVLLDRALAFVDTAEQLVMLDAGTGVRLHAPVPGAARGTVPLPLPSGLLYVDKGAQLQQLTFSGGDGRDLAPKVWLTDTSALGGMPSNPGVLTSTGLYMAWPGWGLLKLRGTE